MMMEEERVCMCKMGCVLRRERMKRIAEQLEVCAHIYHMLSHAISTDCRIEYRLHLRASLPDITC
jgi:hypothetical protein